MNVGFINYLTYIMALIQEVFKYLFDLTSGHLSWTHTFTGASQTAPGSSQWALSGNLPNLSEKGMDIVAAIMTIVHYGLVAVAQFVTLLPANGVD